MGSEEIAENTKWSAWSRSFFAVNGAIIVFVFIGITESQSAVLLPQLKEAGSFIHVTTDQETWIASLGVVTAPIFAVLIGPFIDALGRRKGLQFFYFSMALGFGVIASAQEVYQIYIGRIICGFAAGSEVCAIVYMAEVSTEKQRSFLFAMISVVYMLGVVLSSIVGGFLHWNIASSIFSLVGFIYFIMQCFIPESPPWLFKVGRENAATRSLERLGRRPSEIVRELQTFQLSTGDSKEKVELRTFLQPTVWKPFVIILIFFFLQTASGAFDLISYTAEFIDNLGTNYNALTVAMVLSTIRLLSNATLNLYFRSNFGRRLTLVMSSVMMTISLIGAGLYEYTNRGVGEHERQYQWFLIGCVVVYAVSSDLGVVTLPWVVAGEVYPLKVRGTMTGASFFCGYVFMFFFLKIYYSLLCALKIHGLLFFFAVPSMATIVFGMFVLPETRGKSLFEIEQGFLPKKDRVLPSHTESSAVGEKVKERNGFKRRRSSIFQAVKSLSWP